MILVMILYFPGLLTLAQATPPLRTSGPITSVIKSADHEVISAKVNTRTVGVPDKSSSANLSEITVTVGAGDGGCFYPYTSYFKGGRTQLLYTASELSASGATPGNISSIGFNVYNYSSQVMNNFSISLGNTTTTTLTNWNTTALQTCFSGNYSVPGNGWQMILLQTPFHYDGTNLVVNICYSNASSTANSFVYGEVSSVAQIHTYWDDASAGCSYNGYANLGFVVLPNLRFTEAAIPGPAVNLSPADNSTDIQTAATLNWSPPLTGGTPSGYKLYFGTDNPPANILNGTDLGNVLTYDPNPDLNISTTYYWKLVPYNSAGDATGVSTWSFTTSGLPSSWVSCRVGNSSGTAAYSAAGGRFTLTSTGYSASSSDVQEYVNQSLTGNGTIIARVSDITGGGWAGLQIRESCDPGSRKVLIKTQLQTLIRAEIRQTNGGPTLSTQIMRQGIKWLKLVRTANRFDAYTSVDGNSWWSAFSTTLLMNSSLEIGMFSEGMSYAKTYQSRFDNVMVTGASKTAEAKILQSNPEQDRHIDIYPNPATKVVNIVLSQAALKVSLNIVSVEGKRVYSGTIAELSSQIDISSFKPGIYILRFVIDDAIVSRRLVVL